MSDQSDNISEAVDAAAESRLNSIIALLVAITATFMALSSVKAGNIGQAMAAEQAHTIDQWAYFQAKSTKQSLAEATLDMLVAQRASVPSPELEKKIASYTERVKRYDREKNEIRAVAERHQKNYEALNFHDDQFDLSDAALSVAIALFGVTALTQKRWLLYFALVVAGIGVFFGLCGFFGWMVDPGVLVQPFS